jgi:hypothetical protein
MRLGYCSNLFPHSTASSLLAQPLTITWLSISPRLLPGLQGGGRFTALRSTSAGKSMEMLGTALEESSSLALDHGIASETWQQQHQCYTSIPNTHMLRGTHFNITIVEAAKLWKNGPFGLY